MSINRLMFFLFAPVCILLCGVSGNIQKVNDSIILHDEKFTFTPREFYIADVTDERKDRSSVASLIENNPDHSSVIKQVNLKGGAAVAVKQFIYRNLYLDRKLRPVIVSIKQFKISEASSPGDRVDGRLVIVFSFALQLNYRTVHLVDYSSGIRYSRPGSPPADPEVFLRQGIGRALSYFDKWIDSQADHNVSLAKGVKVRFTDYSEKPEGDTIYYSVNRPLTWDDFKDKPRDSRFEAEIFTSIGYIERNEVIKGIIYVNMAIKVDVAKSDCWVRGTRDDYMLNHEQRHFDIEKIVSEHFKKKILAIDLPVDNYDGPINMEYLETLREATAMQKQYDAETRHGQDRWAQEQWNEKIDKELKAYGVKGN